MALISQRIDTRLIRIRIDDSRSLWDAKKQKFIDVEPGELKLEHNLLAISKWEAKWKKAWLGPKEKTEEELIDYIRCMEIEPLNTSSNLHLVLNKSEMNAIFDYISSPATATGFRKKPQQKNPPSNNKDVITSELIYYWITQFGIDWRVETWHLNRLLTLIKIFQSRQPKQPKIPKVSSYRPRRR